MTDREEYVFLVVLSLAPVFMWRAQAEFIQRGHEAEAWWAGYCVVGLSVAAVLALGRFAWGVSRRS